MSEKEEEAEEGRNDGAAKTMMKNSKTKLKNSKRNRKNEKKQQRNRRKYIRCKMRKRQEIKDEDKKKRSIGRVKRRGSEG